MAGRFSFGKSRGGWFGRIVDEPRLESQGNLDGSGIHGCGKSHCKIGLVMRSYFWSGRTIRYTLIGVICALLNNLTIIVGNFYGISYISMTIIAFLTVTPMAYLMHAKFTFEVSGSLRSFLRFVAGLATAFPVFFLCMSALCGGLHLRVVAAAPTATVFLYIWNYASSHWAFRRDQ